MDKTFTQLYIQIVFAVKGKQNLIPNKHKVELQKYISGIVQNRNQKLLSIYCMPDHVHLLVAISTDISISDLVRDIKAGSSNFINKSNWMVGKFNWQTGFGAFSHSKSDMDDVIKYILNQENHHATNSFKNEYISMLNEHEIQYEEKYLFEWIE